jgi:hypothetical protein
MRVAFLLRSGFAIVGRYDTAMDVNPYETPRELAPPQWRASWPVSRLHGLRAFGVYGGMGCVGGFFVLMLLIVSHGKLFPGKPWLEYTAIGTVIAIFLGCIICLMAIVVGNVVQK